MEGFAMKKDSKNKYALALANFLYEKYFNKHLLEKKYIQNFGDLLLEKKKNTYNVMVMNWKLEDNFRRIKSSSTSLQHDNMVDVMAKSQFADLHRQIIDLEKQIKINDEELKELNFLNKQDVMKAFTTIVLSASPYFNKSKRARKVWKEFKQVINNEDWRKLLNVESVARSLNIYDPKTADDKYEFMAVKLRQSKLALLNRHPFNIKNILKDENEIINKQMIEEDDANYMKESFLKVANIYLATSNDSLWTS